MIEENVPVGKIVTKNEIDIADYDLVSEASQSLTIDRDAWICFAR